MKKVFNTKSFSSSLLNLAFLTLFSIHLMAQAPVASPKDGVPAATTTPVAGAGDAVKGKQLFNANCASCHKLDAKMTGPALRGVGDKYDKAWLYKWIKNSSEVIKSGDAKAVAIYNEYNKVAMTAFPQLSEGDIDNIIAYTMEPAPVADKTTVAPITGGATADSGNNSIVLFVMIFILAVLIYLLYAVKKYMNDLADKKGLNILTDSKSKPLWKSYVENQFLLVVSAILFLLISAYFIYGYLMQIGVDQGYAPVQPIHYSHKIHAGENGIDCKYCHSSARTSKHSGIPSLNVCMNCHKNINEFTGTKDSIYDYSKEFYTAEIKKLYDAVGWDPAKQAYTGVQKPVKWVRIHNLPDLVYFNHAQHVTVGGVECQTCHGKVETFEIMKQDAPLTMGWCINCHRETQVKLADNPYYKKIHDKLAKKYGKTTLTVAEMGGTECGKCHY